MSRFGAFSGVLLFVASINSADCPRVSYRVQGIVLDQNTREPVAGVKIVTRGPVSLITPTARTAKKEIHTTSDGKFDLRVSFDTYSGHSLIHGDLCDASLPKEAQLIFEKTGYESYTCQVKSQFHLGIELQRKAPR